MNKKVIIIFGPPGAGKGTQSELLADKLDLYYLETSKVLEREFRDSPDKTIEIEGEKFDFSKEKQLWLEGKLCSPPLATELIKMNIQKLAGREESPSVQ